MKSIDLLGLVLANLRRQKLRTALTTIGVVVGTAAVTTMVSVGIGVKRSLIQPLEGAELLTTITVQPVKVDFSTFSLSDFGRGGMQKLRERKKLTDATVKDLRAIDHVISVYPDRNVPVTVEVAEDPGAPPPAPAPGAPGDGERRADRLTVIGIDVLPDDAITPGLREAILAGAFWDGGGPRGCVLPSNRLADLGLATPADAVGKELVFRSPRTFFETAPGDAPSEQRQTVAVRVAGVYDSEMLGLGGSRALLPEDPGIEVFDLAGPLGRMTFGGRMEDDEHRALTVKVGSREDLDAVRKAIDERGYGTITATDVIGLIDTVFIGIEAALGLIGSVGLIVAFFGIANTMVMAVLERTKEIGVLKALGARDRDVRRIFVLEAAAIGFAGGALGLLASKLLGDLLDLIANRVFAEAGSKRVLDLFQISAWLAVGAVAFSVVTAVIAGLYPAWRASRLDPVVALRHD